MISAATTPERPDRLSIHRGNTLRGRTTITEFFDTKVNLRLETRQPIRAAYSIQYETFAEERLVFLIMTSKRVAKRAHDRNQLKRWLRAGIAENPRYAELRDQLAFGHMTATLLLTPTLAPGPDMNWPRVQIAVTEVATAFKAAIDREVKQQRELGLIFR